MRAGAPWLPPDTTCSAATNGVRQREHLSFRRKALAAALAGTLVLAACGDDDDDDARHRPSAGRHRGRPAATDTTAGGDRPTTTGDTDAGGSDTTTGGTGTGGRRRHVELAGGEVFVTGSSTVEPISIRVGELALEQSGGDLAVTVEGPGTGDGFATFCEGGADIADASRPINDEEIALCEDGGVEYVELEVAIDGLTVATSPANEAITCLDVPALYALVGPESEGTRQLERHDASWPPRSGRPTPPTSRTPRSTSPAPVRSPARTTRSSSSPSPISPRSAAQDEATRADYASSPNDNLIVDGIESSESSLGWIGYAFYAAEQERMKAIEIDAGDGCVAPTAETIADGTYPFSRSLYIYVNTANAESNPAVASFVDLYLSDGGPRHGHRRRLRRPARRPHRRHPGRLGRPLTSRRSSYARGRPLLPPGRPATVRIVVA